MSDRQAWLSEWCPACRAASGSRCRFVDVERWSGRDELALALEGPVWDRYGHFTGHPQIRGTVTWLVTDRLIVIAR